MNANKNVVSLRPETETELQDFQFNGYPLRAFLRGDEPWFIGNDACDLLEYKNKSHTLSKLDDDEKDVIAIRDSIGRLQNTTVINESGLYSLIFSSEMPLAKEFKKRVTSDILPTIRKTGSYNSTLQPMTPAEMLLANVQLVVDMERRQLALESDIAAAKVAQDAVATKQAELETDVEGIKEAVKQYGLVPGVSARQQVNDLVRNVYTTDKSLYKKRWDHLYTEFQKRYKKNVRLTAKNRNIDRAKLGIKTEVKALDIVEELHYMDQLLKLAVLLFG